MNGYPCMMKRSSVPRKTTQPLAVITVDYTRFRSIMIIPVVGLKRITCLILVLILALNSVSLNHVEAEKPDTFSISAEYNDLSGVNVAIYEGYTSFFDPRCNESKWALHHMFNWMNATVMIIDRDDINNGALYGFEIFVIPEGLGPTLESKLGDDAMQAIRDWVSEGGSYIGVRGSTSLAVTRGYMEGSWETFDLALVNGTTYEVTDLASYCVTNVTINTDCFGENHTLSFNQREVFFRTGRYFEANEGQEIIVVGEYAHSGLPAMIASYYGEGTVFLSSPHFEYEENGDRDGTDYMDIYDDDDSEWPFILEICHWLIDASPTVRNMTWTPPVTTSTTTTTSSTSSSSLTTSSFNTTSTGITTTETTTTTSTTSTTTIPQEFPTLIILGAGTLILGVLVIGILLMKRKT